MIRIYRDLIADDQRTRQITTDVTTPIAHGCGAPEPDLGCDLRVYPPDWACVGQAGWSWCGRCSTP
jgi:hypothetical protein